MEEKILVFEKDGVIKNAFRKSKQSSNIDKVNIRKIVISSKGSYGKKKAYLNMLILMFYHHHYP